MRQHKLTGAALAAAICISVAPSALAQNTGGIFPPTVNEGHKSAQYRITYNPDTEGFAQRLHYQQAINGNFMWRALAQARKTDDSDFDLDFIQGELFWELSDDDDAWKTGLRFDGRIRTDGRPALIGAHWTNQFALNDNWNARFVALSSFDVGDDARDGIFLQTRGNIYTKLETGQTLGLEYFSNHGSTDDLPALSDQAHQLGPFASFKVTDDISLFTGALFGVSDAAADSELRLWISKSF